MPTMPNITGILDKLFAEYQAGKAKSEALFAQGESGLKDVVSMFQPGGAFEQSAMRSYELGKSDYMGNTMQGLMGAGLAKTSLPGQISAGYEERVGTPYRIGVAAEGSGRLASAMKDVAQYGLGYQNLYPNAGTLSYLATGGFGAISGAEAQKAQLAAQVAANQQPVSQPYSGGGSGSYGPSPFEGLLGGGGSTTGGGGGSTTYNAPNISFSDMLSGASPSWASATGGGAYEPGANMVSNLATKQQVPFNAPEVSASTSGGSGVGTWQKSKTGPGYVFVDGGKVTKIRVGSTVKTVRTPYNY